MCWSKRKKKNDNHYVLHPFRLYVRDKESDTIDFVATLLNRQISRLWYFKRAYGYLYRLSRDRNRIEWFL